MKRSFKNSKLYKILTGDKLYKIFTGDTKTNQVSGSAVEIVFNKDLSSQVYDKIDCNINFTVTSKQGKTFRIKQLQTR